MKLTDEPSILAEAARRAIERFSKPEGKRGAKLTHLVYFDGYYINPEHITDIKTEGAGTVVNVRTVDGHVLVLDGPFEKLIRRLRKVGVKVYGDKWGE